MAKKSEMQLQRAPQKKLYFFYDGGINEALDEKIEKAVGKGAFSTGYWIELPQKRDLLFLFPTFQEALLAARCVGQLAIKIDRTILFNIV